MSKTYSPGCTEITLTHLRKLLDKNDVVFYITRRTFPSGTKYTDFYLFRHDQPCPAGMYVRNPLPIRITRYICDLLGYRWADAQDGGLVSQCFGNDIVDRLGQELFGLDHRLRAEQL